jgi:hypothetical protein
LEEKMTPNGFGLMKAIERQMVAMYPIIELLQERRAAINFGEDAFNDVVCRVQRIGQELLALIQDGLL